MGEFRVRQNAGGADASFALSKALNEWFEEFGPTGIFRTCGSCRNMQKAGEPRCALFNAVPPVGIILAGCEKHDDEHEVPF